MKVKFLVLFLCIEGYSAMAASATIATDCELPKATVSNAAGGGGASSGSPVGDLVDSKELNAHVLIEAQRHFPEDYVSVVYAEKHKSSNISPLFNRLSSLWHGAVRVTLKSMEKELYLYLNSTGQCTVLLEADPDTMHCKSHSLNAPVNQEDGKAGAFTQMEARVRFTTLEGVCRYVKYIMRTEIDTAESDYRFSYRYDDLLPVLDKSIEVSHVTTEYLNGSEYTLIEGCNKTKHVQVCYISKLGEVPRIVYEATDDINVLFLTQGGFLYESFT